MKLKHFGINNYGRDFVVGDIHGNFHLLEDKLEEIGFDSYTDRLFSVGDLVDRGSNSETAIDWLCAYDWFHAVRGNHEQMAIDAADGFYDPYNYINNGGKWFLDLPKETQKEYAAEFKELPIAIEIETKNGLVGIVHAEAAVKYWEDIITVPETHILWSRDKIHRGDTSVIEGVYKIYVGHTPVEKDRVFGNTHYIDTGAFYTGKLTILEI